MSLIQRTLSVDQAAAVASTFLGLGDFATFSLTSLIAARLSLSAALWIGAATCGLGFCVVIVYALIDKFYSNATKAAAAASAATAAASETTSPYSSMSSFTGLANAPTKLRGVAADSTTPLLAAAAAEQQRKLAANGTDDSEYSGLENNNDDDDDDDDEGASTTDGTSGVNDDQEAMPVTLSGWRAALNHFTVFDARFWALAATSTCLAGSYTSFTGFGPALLEHRYGMTEVC